jgi:hypothetical protein
VKPAAKELEERQLVASVKRAATSPAMLVVGLAAVAVAVAVVAVAL